KEIEKAGADALTLHARLAIHGRSIPADHSWTKKLKEKISIPLIANGDIFNPQDAEKLIEFADGVMIARGAIGDPLIFTRTLHYLKTHKEKTTSPKQNIKLFLNYLKLAKKHELEDISRIKYLGSNFLKNFQGASQARQKLMALKTPQEITDFTTILIKHL